MSKFNTGDKVRCVKKEYTYDVNHGYIVVGDVYTVAAGGGVALPNEITLEEINKIEPGKPYFDVRDFQLVTISVITDDAPDDADAAYNRAMSIL